MLILPFGLPVPAPGGDPAIILITAILVLAMLTWALIRIAEEA